MALAKDFAGPGFRHASTDIPDSEIFEAAAKAAEALVKGKARPLAFKKYHYLPQARPDVSDQFASYRGPQVCQSTSGRWRPEHEWDKDDQCVFCNKEKPLLPERSPV